VPGGFNVMINRFFSSHREDEGKKILLCMHTITQIFNASKYHRIKKILQQINLGGLPFGRRQCSKLFKVLLTSAITSEDCDKFAGFEKT
jgi:hypothetical protein